MLVAIPAVAAPARTDTGEKYKQQALYLYNFISYVEWPEKVYEGKLPRINLCIIGPDTLGEYIDTVAEKSATIGTAKINVIRSPAQSALASCDIAYISPSTAYGGYIAQLGSRPVLTVSEAKGFAGKGGTIGFVMEKDKLGFAVNNGRANKQGLKISPELLEIATEVIQ